MGARANVHLKVLYGRSNHHKIEPCFKAFAPRAARGVRERQAAGEDAAQHQGPAVIALVDYGAGNLTSVRKALTAIGRQFWTPPRRRNSRRRTASSCRASATSTPRARSTRRGGTPSSAACDDGVPLLGICVGLQWLFEGATEAPDVPGPRR